MPARRDRCPARPRLISCLAESFQSLANLCDKGSFVLSVSDCFPDVATLWLAVHHLISPPVSSLWPLPDWQCIILTDT